MTQTPKVEKISILDDLMRLSGVSAHNRQEPSSGDLERVGNAYAIALNRIHDLETALKSANIFIETLDQMDWDEQNVAAHNGYRQALAKVDLT